MKESDLQVQVADYIRLRYPDVLFHSDFGSGIKLTKGQAIKQKRQNGGRRGWPDMFIAEPKHIWDTNKGLGVFIGYTDDGETRLYSQIMAGLMLELKKDGTRLKKKDGSWATDHIAEQAKILQALRDRGYVAEFAVGFEEAKKIIDEYLGGEDA